MELIVITNPYDLMFETDKLNRLFREGLKVLHVRKPGYTNNQMRAFLDQIDQQFHKRIVLGSNISLCQEYIVKGIHIGNAEVNSILFRNIFLKIYKRKNKQLTVSTTVDSLDKIDKNYKILDYLLLSKIYQVYAHEKSILNFNLSEIKNALLKTPYFVFGMGGINNSNIDQTKSIGFQGAAIQSFIWKSVDPIKAYKEVVQAANGNNARDLAIGMG